MAEALAKVKKDLGRDAVILNTRTRKKGGVLGLGGQSLVEITAAEDVNVLHPRQTRGIIGPNRSVGGRAERAEGAAVQAPWTPSSIQSPPNMPADPLRQEMAELRALVREVVQDARRRNAPDVPQALTDYYLKLIQADVADEVARELIQRLSDRLTGDRLTDADAVRAALRDYVASMVPAAGPIAIDEADRPKVVALVGPTGVGKTTTIAKLAAHFKLRENRRVGLITIDTYRIAAVDQLRTYAQIIAVPLEVVLTASELGDALARLAGCDIILIDTAGRGPGDRQKLDELNRFLDVAAPDETHLVLACNTSQAALLRAVERFNAVGVDRVVFTKLDESVGFGVLLNVIRQVNKKLSYLTTGQNVPDDIEVGRGQRIADLIVPSPACAPVVDATA